MPPSNAIRAGRAFVEVFADDSRLVRGLRRAQKRLQAFGRSVRDMGVRIFSLTTAAFAPLGGLAIKAASDAQETLSRFEQVFGDQADAAAKFADDLAASVGRSKFAIRDALSTFQSFFVGLGFNATDARGLSQSLQQLAIDFASFNNLSDDEAMQRFISALSGSSEVLDRFGINIKQAALEQELLRMGISKSWTEVTEQEKALARLNVIMRSMTDQGAVGDAVRTSGSFANQMKRLRGQLHDTAVVIGQALLPVVTPLVAKAAKLIQQVAEWAKQNQKLIATVFKIAAVVAAGGVAMIVFGIAVSTLGGILGGLATVLTAVGAGIGLVGTVLGALLSPIGLVIAAVTALGATVLIASGTGADALKWLGDRFVQLRDEAMVAFRGIADALAAGDIGLAARILWLTLKLQWQKGVNALQVAWLRFKQAFLEIAHAAFFGALAAMEIAWHGIEVAFIETSAFLSKVWTKFTAGFRKTWNTAVNWVAKRLVELQGLADSSFDSDEAKRLLDQDLQADNRAIDRQRDSSLSEAEQQRQRRRDDAERQHEQTLSVIGEQDAESQRQLQDEFDRQMTDTADDLDAARQEWLDAIEEARRKREASADGEGVPGAGGAPSVDDLLSQLGGLGGRLEQAVGRSVASRGTFNAAAIQGLMTNSSVAERTAAAAEATARNTKKIEREVREGGVAFA
jgi:hypothetical protein